MSDYIQASLNGMLELQRANRSIMLLGLARCCGTRTDSGKSTFLPLTRMPTGLIEHQINFFNSSHKSQAGVRSSAERAEH